MDNNIIGLAAIISAIVSATVTIIIRIIENVFSKYLETHKSRLSKQVTLDIKYEERRLLIYPKMVSLIYRLRNMARDITNMDIPRSSALLEELKERAHEYYDYIIVNRSELERDELFKEAHAYKNTILNLCLAVSNEIAAQELEDKGSMEQLKNDIENIYNEIESKHEPLITSLSVSD